jgi:hypothetical protein
MAIILACRALGQMGRENQLSGGGRTQGRPYDRSADGHEDDRQTATRTAGGGGTVGSLRIDR